MESRADVKAKERVFGVAAHALLEAQRNGGVEVSGDGSLAEGQPSVIPALFAGLGVQFWSP
jgi:hypothetical protein